MNYRRKDWPFVRHVFIVKALCVVFAGVCCKLRLDLLMKNAQQISGKSKPVQFPRSNGLKFHSLGYREALQI